MSDMMTNIGISALNAAQAGLLTTSNNIANASTPGYSREQTVQTPSTALNLGSGYFGQGVNVATIQRIYSSFITTQLQQQQSSASQLSTYYNQIQQINNVIGGTTGGLTSAIQGFFTAINTVASTPSSTAARQSVLSNAQTLAGTFQTLNQTLTGLATSTNQQIQTSVSNINSYAQQIATLNQSIIQASSVSSNQPPNTLLDQRNQLINQLSQEINTSVIRQANGSDTVYIGNGQPLVVGSQSMTVKTLPSQSNPAQLDIAYVTSNGTSLRLPANTITGGNLGGLLAFQNQSLVPTQSQLGLIATGLASNINNQQAQGLDLNGQLGTALFTVASPVVIANQANSGTSVPNVSIANANALTGSNYTLSYNGSQYTLTRLSDHTVTTSTTLPLSVDGLSIQFSSVPASGNSYLIEPTINGAQNIGVALSDPTKIAAAVPVQSNAALTNIGTGTIATPTVNAGLPLNPNLMSHVKLTFANPTQYNVTGTVSATPGNSNTGSAAVTATIPTGAGTAGSSYTLTYTGGGNYTLTESPSPGTTQSYTSASFPITTADGVTFNVSGTPSTGDTFQLGSPLNVAYTSGASIAYNGWTTSISGTPQTNDVFSVSANTGANSDGNNALAMSNLQSQNLLLGGTSSFTGTYAQLVAQVGSQTSQLQVTSTAQTNLVNQTTQTQQSISGVNLNEEAANLIQYQQDYQAASKAIQVAGTMFTTVLSMLN